MPEISENSHKISAAQLFCILLLMRVSSELAYPSKGGFGGSGLAAALTAEAVRFLIALPVLIYACKGGGFYAAVWRKNRFLGWVAAVGAALLLAGFVVRTAVYASGFVRRNMLLKTPQLLIALLMAAFAVYAAVKGGEALARAGVAVPVGGRDRDCTADTRGYPLYGFRQGTPGMEHCAVPDRRCRAFLPQRRVPRIRGAAAVCPQQQ